MKFPGYWVYDDAGTVILERAIFDETELDPATDWKQAWQNQDSESTPKGYIELDAALIYAAECFARADGRTLSQEDLDQATCFEPWWSNDRCTIRSLSHLLGSNIS